MTREEFTERVGLNVSDGIFEVWNGVYMSSDKDKDEFCMYLDATCEGLPSSKWEALMKGARRVSYRMLVSRVKSEIPELYRALALNLYNPWADQCRQTATHFILVHSAIEYFIHK